MSSAVQMGGAVVDWFDDLLFAMILAEGAVCLACAFMLVLVAPYSAHHHHRLLTHLTMFAVAGLTLLLTAALADAYRSLRHRRPNR